MRRLLGVGVATVLLIGITILAQHFWSWDGWLVVELLAGVVVGFYGLRRSSESQGLAQVAVVGSLLSRLSPEQRERLRSANLSGADLRGADLSNADLRPRHEREER